MTTPSKLRIAVVNPLSITGKEIRSLLRERHFPIGSMALLDTPERNAGAITEEAGEAAYVVELAADSLDGLDVLFLCDTGAETAELAKRAVKNGTAVIEIPPAGDSRSGGKWIVSGLNDSSLAPADRHAAVPRASALLLSRLIAPLRTVAKIRRLTITVIEPASTRGDAGVEEMLGQAVALLNFNPLPKNVFGRQMVFNVFPAPAHDGAAIVEEIAEIFGEPVNMAVSVLRGPSFHGHGFTVLAEMGGDPPPDATAIEAAFEATPELEVDRFEMIPGTVEASGTDVVRLAPPRAEPSIPGAFWLWMVVDHLRAGTALNAVRIAEKMAGAGPPAGTGPKRTRRGRT